MDVDELSEATDEECCGKPCDPNLHTECCAEYWQRMEREGYWDRDQHRWTEKGWREITK
jgi:hypothetical protein